MTDPQNRRDALGTLAMLAAWAAAPSARAQSDKPLRFILPHATGSGVDAIARAAQPALARAFGHPIVIDNQPGAGGIVGLQALSRAAPDGLTLGLVSNNVVILPSVMKSVPFDMPGDFTPIAVVGHTPMVVVVNARVPAGNARELAALLRSRNGDMTFASGGNGTILHLASELLIDEVPAKARHIPYKGVGPMLTDLIGGQVDFATAALPSVQGHLKSGALKAIGIATAQRSPAAPDIPTFAEQGMPNFVVEGWVAVIGPKGLAAAEVQRVHAAVSKAFADAEVREAMARQGNVIQVAAAEKATPFFRSELARYAALVRKAGVEAQ